MALACFGAVAVAGPHRASDEGAYVHLAYVIAARRPPVHGAPSLWFGPGLPLLLSPLVLLHVPLQGLRLVGPVALALALVLFARLLALHVSERPAALATLAFAAYVPFYVLLPTLHSELPAVLAVVVFMYGAALDLRRPTRSRLLLAAAGLALLALSRPVFGWVILVVLGVWVIVALVRRAQWAVRLAAIHTVALVLCLPWLVHTFAVSHKVFYWSSSAGLSLYWMASPYAGQEGDWHASSEVFRLPALAPNRPDFVRLHSLDQVRYDAFLHHRAVELIRAHPGAYGRHLTDNFSRMWFNVPYSFEPDSAGALLYVVPNTLILAMLVFAAAVIYRRRGSALPAEWTAAALVVAGVACQLPFAAYPRMIAPLVPAMLFLGASAAAKVGATTGSSARGAAP